jgi:hypothetical protein
MDIILLGVAVLTLGVILLIEWRLAMKERDGHWHIYVDPRTANPIMRRWVGWETRPITDDELRAWAPHARKRFKT